MSRPAHGWAVTAIALVAVMLGSGLEGGTEHRFGAMALLVASLAGVVALQGGELPKLGKWPRAAVIVLVLVLIAQTVPLPAAIRAIVAPGSTARLHELAGTLAVSGTEWLTQLSRLNVAVLVGESPPYTFDPLQGAHDGSLRSLALSAAGQQWQLGMWAAYALLVVAGWRIARDTPTLRVFLVGIIAIAVLEALFGLGNRNGPSTGIGKKVAYLGSATGTFINRGHFAAFLTLAIGALWGLAASLFPLLPEEVRRHQARKRRSSQPPGLLEASGDKVPRLILLTFTAALLFVAVVASNSRGPLVALVLAGLGVGGWAWWRREERVHIGFGVGVPAAGLLLAVFALGPRGALGRFGTLGTDDVSLTSRIALWRAAGAALMDSPIVGTGPGSWAAAFGPQERGAHLYEVAHAHSEPLEMLLELGVVGFAALAVLTYAFLRGVARRIDVVDHDLQTAVGFGALVAVLAVGIQSFTDFPFRTPGVGIPFFLFVGVVLASFDVAPPTGTRWPGLLIAALAGLLLIPAGFADHQRGGPKHLRRSEAAAAVLLPRPTSAAEAVSLADTTCGEADDEPFDAWQQLACGIAASRVAANSGSAEMALRAEVATLRALRLHPNDPRLHIQVAQVWIRLGPPTLLKYAYDERATRLLMDCIRLDGWRAEDAFKLARGLPSDAVDRLGGAASDQPISRSRTLYQYGVVLDERGRDDDAAAVLEQAAAADPQYGPPAFRAGLVARQRGDTASAQRWFQAFIAARDRPTAMEGWSLLYLDEPAAAEVRFRRAIAENDKNRWAWEGVAAVAAVKADRADECTAWRRVLHLTPKHPQAIARSTELGC